MTLVRFTRPKCLMWPKTIFVPVSCKELQRLLLFRWELAIRQRLRHRISLPTFSNDCWLLPPRRKSHSKKLRRFVNFSINLNNFFCIDRSKNIWLTHRNLQQLLPHLHHQPQPQKPRKKLLRQRRKKKKKNRMRTWALAYLTKKLEKLMKKYQSSNMLHFSFDDQFILLIDWLINIFVNILIFIHEKQFIISA